MKALIYTANVDYSCTSRWDTPSAIWVTETDVLLGVARRECPDCGGTGHFPMPDRELEDFCVMCKGTGLTLVSV